jgi:hypothetical protein
VVATVVFAVFAANFRIEIHSSSFPSLSEGPSDLSSPSPFALVTTARPASTQGPTIYVKLDPLAEAEPFLATRAPTPPPAAAADPAAATSLAAPPRRQRATLLSLLGAASKQMLFAVLSIVSTAGEQLAAAALAVTEPLLQRLQDPRSWSYVLSLTGAGGRPQPAALPSA